MKELSFSFEKRYGEKILRAEDSLSFGPGAWVQALMGDSGSGKTTFARWLAGFEPGAGRLSFGGEVWQQEAPKKIYLAPQARKVAMLPQVDALFPHLTVEENVCFGLRGLSKPERIARAHALLSLVGLAQAAGRRPAALSGGERRRAALAQALAPGPRLLILDEPFTGLHEEAKKALWAELHTWIEKAELPTLLITHEAREAAAFGAAPRRFVSCSLLP